MSYITIIHILHIEGKWMKDFKLRDYEEVTDVFDVVVSISESARTFKLKDELKHCPKCSFIWEREYFNSDASQVDRLRNECSNCTQTYAEKRREKAKVKKLRESKKTIADIDREIEAILDE